MYEWITIGYFIYRNFAVSPGFVQYPRADQACLEEPQRSYALQSQEIGYVVSRQDGQRIIGRSGQFRLRVVPIECKGKIEVKVKEPKP